MVGHKLGEFSHTRTFKGHSKAGSVASDKKSTVAPAAAGPKK
jgi:ribosomal protein S19